MNLITSENWKNIFSELDFDFSFLDNLDNDNRFPSDNLIFNIFNIIEPNDIKVVILGQDPYIKDDEAMGLSFSVPDGTNIPPSLRNIFKNLDISNRKNGDLTNWAEQGVFLLNCALTVQKGRSNSHAKQWKPITDKIIKWMSDNNNDIVFLLWGNYSIKKKKLIDFNKHHVLETSHPSPLGCYRGFNESNHFNECNDILKNLNKDEIDWT